MSAATWFFLGLFVGWTPFLVVLALLLWRATEAHHE
jgi:hypothetical protein